MVGLQILALPIGVRIPTPQSKALVGQENFLPYFFNRRGWADSLQKAVIG